MALRPHLVRGLGRLAIVGWLAASGCDVAPAEIVGSLSGPEGPSGPEAPIAPSNPVGDGLCVLPLPPDGCPDTPTSPQPVD